jgi:di/tricarboxylate transporter
VGFDAFVVVSVAAAALAALALSRLPPDAVLAAALTSLLVLPGRGPDGWRLGVVSLEEAFAGFSNTGLLTVGVLYVVVTGLRETGAIDWVAQSVLGRPKTHRRALARLIGPVIGASAFLNNTPLVAMLIPAVDDWARRLRLSPSKLMIPLSYAAILGGSCSLIGTSTNLVVAGLAAADGDLPAIRMFDVTWVGLPCALVGAAFLLLLSPRLLPDRASAAETLQDPREYAMEMVVPESSPLAGRSVEEAGLRHLPGAYLASVERNGDSQPAIPPEFVLRAGDRLLFTGVVDSIRDLQNQRGLEPATNQALKLDAPRYSRQLFEAVISPTCPLVGKTVREGRFRNRYNAAILAAARNGVRLSGKIGDIRLRPGDTLLIEASRAFDDQHRNSRDFLLVSAIRDSAPRRYEKTGVAAAILAAMVVVAALGWLPMLTAAAVAAGAMLLTRCCSFAEARASIDWPVLIVIGCALGLGAALDSSGAAGFLAEAAISGVGDRPWLALATVYVATWLTTETLTNNAAVALIFPIAMATARGLGADPFPFVMAVTMAGSASFSTPIGYQTNLMVYGPGGYRFGDFVRIGAPMNLAIGATALVAIPLVWPLR